MGVSLVRINCPVQTSLSSITTQFKGVKVTEHTLRALSRCDKTLTSQSVSPIETIATKCATHMLLLLLRCSNNVIVSEHLKFDLK